jgi:hypothetical protein
MAIVDWTYYTEVYMGTEATETEFPAIEARAEDVVGAMTRWTVTADTIASLPAFTRTLVKKAICAQIDFLAVNGLDSVSTTSGVGFTVGKVSVNNKSGEELVHKGTFANSIAPLAQVYLEQTGLMNPQVNVIPDMGEIPC